jgi:hypothetical protein
VSTLLNPMAAARCGPTPSPAAKYRRLACDGLEMLLSPRSMLHSLRTEVFWRGNVRSGQPNRKVEYWDSRALRGRVRCPGNRRQRRDTSGVLVDQPRRDVIVLKPPHEIAVSIQNLGQHGARRLSRGLKPRNVAGVDRGKLSESGVQRFSAARKSLHEIGAEVLGTPDEMGCIDVFTAAFCGDPRSMGCKEPFKKGRKVLRNHVPERRVREAI